MSWLVCWLITHSYAYILIFIGIIGHIRGILDNLVCLDSIINPKWISHHGFPSSLLNITGQPLNAEGVYKKSSFRAERSLGINFTYNLLSCLSRALGSNNVCICGSLGTQAYLYVQQQVCQHIYKYIK